MCYITDNYLLLNKLLYEQKENNRRDYCIIQESR